MYTPRKFRVHPTSSNIAMIETDHNAFTEATKTERRKKMVEVSCLLYVLAYWVPRGVIASYVGLAYSAVLEVVPHSLIRRG